MKGVEQTDNEIRPRMVKHLMLNAILTSDIGLYHGKRGIVLFFAHYGRYTGNTLYNDFAGELFLLSIAETTPEGDAILSWKRQTCKYDRTNLF